MKILQTPITNILYERMKEEPINQSPRVIISGGGTGGHIFPAIAIANEIQRRYPLSKILFVGAKGRMEMEKVPSAGYQIVGLPMMGFDRKRLWRNIKVVWKLLRSMCMARKIIRDFRPDVVIGVGGYASGATLQVASQKRIPILIQEQNSYAGVTNRLLAKKAQKVCVAYKEMEQFFPADKIVITGNPIRQELMTSMSREEACRFWKLDPNKKVVLVVGGSLGAKTLNDSIWNHLDLIEKEQIQLLWQVGKTYYKQISEELPKRTTAKIELFDFINHMPQAYAAADIVISRAGAGAISELTLLHKVAILVPSPNVAEDHQTKNALALVKEHAALLVKDSDAPKELVHTVVQLLDSPTQMQTIAENVAKMAYPHATAQIVDQVETIMLK